MVIKMKNLRENSKLWVILAFMSFAIACSVLQVKSNHALKIMLDLNDELQYLNDDLQNELDFVKSEKAIMREVENIFMVASQVYEIEYELLMAISQHETGNFKSYAWLVLNNAGGIMGAKGLRTYDNKNMGVMELARLLRYYYFDEGYDTIEKIQKKYAPLVAKNDPNGLNRYWVSGVTYYYDKLKGK